MKSKIKNSKPSTVDRGLVRNASTPTRPDASTSLPVSARKINRLRQASSLTSSALEQTNPLRGLTLARAVALMEATLRGEYALPQWTLWHVEQSDPDLIALEARRSSALMEMDWNIKIADLKSRVSGIEKLSAPRSTLDAKLASEQANALLEAYNRFDNLNECIEDMALAFCRGFSISQFEFSGSDSTLSAPRSPDHLGLYDPWNIVRHGLKGDFYFNPEGRSVSWKTLGQDNRIDPANHIIYTPRSNLMRIALYKFVRQNLSQKNWDAFIEIYGIPSCFIIGPPNVPPEKETQFETAAKDAADGAGGYLPNGSDIKFANDARGVNPFRDHLKYLQEQLILAGTGGLLTMLSQPTGIGEGATGAHEDTFKIIARGEAKKISETFQKQFDSRILEAAFPGEPILAYFELASTEEQDVGEIIKHALELSQAGYTMDPAELAEKTGYKITVSQQPPSPAFSPGFFTGGDAANRTRAQMGVFNSAPIPAGSSPDSPRSDNLTDLDKLLADLSGIAVQATPEELERRMAQAVIEEVRNAVSRA